SLQIRAWVPYGNDLSAGKTLADCFANGRLSGPLTALITEILIYVNNEKDPKPVMLCG
ncbi:unnamed protein product, partial [Porites evermanni]